MAIRKMPQVKALKGIFMGDSWSDCLLPLGLYFHRQFLSTKLLQRLSEGMEVRLF